MVWAILTLIAIITTGVVWGVFALGAIFLLVALNGFSESAATPILACYALFVVGSNVAVMGLLNRWVARKWFAEAAVSTGAVMGHAVLFNLLFLALLASFFIIRAS